jgi:hypothetical protein
MTTSITDLPVTLVHRHGLNIALILLASLFAYEVVDLGTFHWHYLWRNVDHSDFDVYSSAALRFLERPADFYDVSGAASLRGTFLYPPLGIVAFVPFTWLPHDAAFVVFQLTSVAASFGCVWLVARSHALTHRDTGYGWRAFALFALLILASGPAYSNSVAGQVSSFVLILCFAAIYLGLVGRPAWAGLLLAFACWLKIYPALLLIAMFGVPVFRRTAIAAMAFGIILPAAFLWLVPLALYKVYFFDLLPQMAGRITNHLSNQSLTASLVRLTLPSDQWVNWKLTEVPAWIKAVNAAAGAGLLLGLYAAGRARRIDPLLTALIALAFVPLLAPLGWGHSFLFAMFLIAYLVTFSPVLSLRVMACVAWLLLLPPAYSELPALRAVAPALATPLYFRYFVAVAAVAIAAMVLGGPSLPLRQRAGGVVREPGGSRPESSRDAGAF